MAMTLSRALRSFKIACPMATKNCKTAPPVKQAATITRISWRFSSNYFIILYNYSYYYYYYHLFYRFSFLFDRISLRLPLVWRPCAAARRPCWTSWDEAYKSLAKCGAPAGPWHTACAAQRHSTAQRGSPPHLRETGQPTSSRRDEHKPESIHTKTFPYRI